MYAAISATGFADSQLFIFPNLCFKPIIKLSQSLFSLFKFHVTTQAAPGKGSINLGQKEKANGREGKSRIRQEDHGCF
jgi:hypothetical protein